MRITLLLRYGRKKTMLFTVFYLDASTLASCILQEFDYIMLDVLQVPALEDNYIWIIKISDDPNVIVVDPGDSSAVFDILEKYALVPVAILLTHHHIDHTGGLGNLIGRYDLPVYGPAIEKIPYVTHPLEGGETLVFDTPDCRFSVFHTPGHTPGHLCYYGENSLFSGDTLFAGGCGGLFGGTIDDMHDSLVFLSTLPKHTLIYCAHEYTISYLKFCLLVEPDNVLISQRLEQAKRLRQSNKSTVPSVLGVELRSNSFLRCQNNKVKSAAEKFCGSELESARDVFTVVHHWYETIIA